MNALLRPGATMRRMRTADLDVVLDIEARCYSFPWTRGNFVDSLAAGYHAQVLQGPAEVQGYLVAMPGVQEMHLLNITVAPSWQRQGLARTMLDALQQHCLAQHLPLLWLEVRASNHRARALYARRGFEEIGLRRNYYPAPAGREDAVVMRLCLDESADVD
jgi:ribosomal-protein-alanine N-acetyltransferase